VIRLAPAALLLIFVAASAWAAPDSGAIRVAIVEGVRSVELRGDLLVMEAGECATCTPRSWRADAVRAVVVTGAVEVDGRRAPAFRVSSGGPMRLNGREYEGRLDVLRNGDAALTVVNELPLEDYLVGVLRAESSERWPMEALRAQAIASRTYAAYHRLLNAGRTYHIVASTAHQQFVGRVIMGSSAWAAVQETTGQVLHWEGDLFPAFYHTNSGGYTEDPRSVFAGRSLPGLRPVVCPLAAGAPNYQWALELRLDDLSELLRRGGVGVGAVRNVEVTERTSSLRAGTVTVRGSARTQRMRGSDFRRVVGYDTLKSTLFAVAIDGDVARFSGRGHGHGVGMCQWGAKSMAELGASSRQILTFYYPGATLTTLTAR
jgi:stage II sporulation protein D (peptidoglycan lytic transglycosylase)